jgi:hypothetical protein
MVPRAHSPGAFAASGLTHSREPHVEPEPVVRPTILVTSDDPKSLRSNWAQFPMLVVGVEVT